MTKEELEIEIEKSLHRLLRRGAPESPNFLVAYCETHDAIAAVAEPLRAENEALRRVLRDTMNLCVKDNNGLNIAEMGQEQDSYRSIVRQHGDGLETFSAFADFDAALAELLKLVKD